MFLTVVIVYLTSLLIIAWLATIFALSKASFAFRGLYEGFLNICIFPTVNNWIRNEECCKEARYFTSCNNTDCDFAATKNLSCKNLLKHVPKAEDSDTGSKSETSTSLDNSSSSGPIAEFYEPRVSTNSELAGEVHDISSSIDEPEKVVDFFNHATETFTKGFESIVADDFIEGTQPAELPMWNLKLRTHPRHVFRHPVVFLFYVLGSLIRYFIFLPIRTMIMLNAMSFLIVCSALIGTMKESSLKRKLDYLMNLGFFRILAQSFGLSVVYHDIENRPKEGSVCVANHSTPLDIPCLSCDNYYSLVGQRHKGWLGLIENALENVSHHIWFNRFERQDRVLTRTKLSNHALAGKPPILIFPEGVCNNNTTLLKFRKGCFELGTPVYPIVIRYDRALGEPLWHQPSWAKHHLDLMTSWCMSAHVHYLPRMMRGADEEPGDFANRVHKVIADAGGMISTNWDGSCKYHKPSQTILDDVMKNEAEKIKRIFRLT